MSESRVRVRIRSLIIGQVYVVRFDDCCVQGSFESRFLGYFEDNDPDDETPTTEWAGWATPIRLSGHGYTCEPATE